MKKRSSAVAVAFLLSLSLSAALASAQVRVDNPECLGSSCGRPSEATPVVGGGFLETVWAELLAFLR